MRKSISTVRCPAQGTRIASLSMLTPQSCRGVARSRRVILGGSAARRRQAQERASQAPEADDRRAVNHAVAPVKAENRGS